MPKSRPRVALAPECPHAACPSQNVCRMSLHAVWAFKKVSDAQRCILDLGCRPQLQVQKKGSSCLGSWLGSGMSVAPPSLAFGIFKSCVRRQLPTVCYVAFTNWDPETEPQLGSPSLCSCTGCESSPCLGCGALEVLVWGFGMRAGFG